jgi:hypothetical protein
MGDWQPDGVLELSSERLDVARGGRIYLWVVPAKIAGRWLVEADSGAFTMTVTQEYQRFRATAQTGARFVSVRDGFIEGTTVVFAADLGKGLQRFTGRIDGDTIVGESPAGWKAIKSAL